MNLNQLTTICKRFNLVAPTNAPAKVFGGLLHRMWRADTNNGSYAIKELSSNIDLKNIAVLNNYELTENIAFRFARQGIPAVSALEQAGKHLVEIEKTFFLVYPWIDAHARTNDTLTEKHVVKIAKILAVMHRINLDVPEIEKPQFDTRATHSLLELINTADTLCCPFAQDLRKNQESLIKINNEYHAAIAVLQKQVVVSHGDLDPKNVLWDKNDNPVLIDWEAARKLNPTYEIVNASLDWCGISTNFNQDLFIKMIATYQAAGGIISQEALHAAFYGALGNWINWMVYNINRACTAQDSEQKTLGIEQVTQTLSLIIKLQSIIPDLIIALEKHKNQES